jgi:hypothetical protein
MSHLLEPGNGFVGRVLGAGGRGLALALGPLSPAPARRPTNLFPGATG